MKTAVAIVALLLSVALILFIFTCFILAIWANQNGDKWSATGLLFLFPAIPVIGLTGIYVAEEL